MWEVIAGVSFFALYSGGLGWLRYRWEREFLGRLQEVVKSCGLQIEKISKPLRRLHLEARDGPLTVKILTPRQSGDFRRVIVIAIPGPPGFSNVHIRREESKPSGAHEIEIGDGPFDKAFYVVGPARLLRALLDADTRHLLITANAESTELEIVNGELGIGTYQRQIGDLLPLLLDVARRLAQPLDVVQRLAGNARRDPDAGVRLHNLILLAREFPGEPATTEALRAACTDESPQVRMQAAKGLGAEGREILLELAESTGDDAISAEAISLLGRELPVERTRALLVQALRRRRHQTARACLEALGHSTAAEDVDTLVKVLTREKSELAAVAATALGRTGSPAAEPPLIQALQGEQEDLQVAAADALARVGTTASVLPLKEAAERAARNRDLLKATRQAIAEIQLRLPGASPGQLSLAGTEAGRLSLAPTEAGQLSLADDPAGQLSLGGS
ncbi:MAG TPA: HEAT repeat domain-containing protein [Thermoanaerobaculia bacterium]|nr:HEAT repeat domain-containing protein [Thermoanaerobaculia bacterium]